MIIVTKKISNVHATGWSLSNPELEKWVGDDHEDAVRAVAKAAGWSGDLYSNSEYSRLENADIVIWSGNQLLYQGSITITPEPLLTWEPGPLWRGECGGTQYEIAKSSNGCVALIIDGKEAETWSEVNAMKTYFEGIMPSLKWRPGPVCVARLGERVIEVHKCGECNYKWTGGRDSGWNYGSLDACKESAEAWARAQK